MTTAHAKLGQILVNVELGSCLARFANSDRDEENIFRDHLLRNLEILLDDLKIPAEVLLVVGLGSHKTDIVASDYQLTVNCQKCRLLLPATVPRDVTAHELARLVARQIYHNRELLIDRFLSEAIWKSWMIVINENSLSKQFQQEFHDFLSLLILNYFNIERVKRSTASIIEATLNCTNANEWQVFGRPAETMHDCSQANERCEHLSRRYFEHAIFDLNNIRLSVILSEQSPLQTSADTQSLEEMLDKMRDDLYIELGVLIPRVIVDTDQKLQKYRFRIQINDVRFPSLFGLESGSFFVNESPAKLAQFNITAKSAINPTDGSRGSIIQDRDNTLEWCKSMDMPTWTPLEFIVLSISSEVRRNASKLLTAETVSFSIDLLRKEFPHLVASVVARFDIISLVSILRDLLYEQISIRNLQGILESLLTINGITRVDLSKYMVFSPNIEQLVPLCKDKTIENVDISDYSKYVRIPLIESYISNSYWAENKTLAIYQLDSLLEGRIRRLDADPLQEKEHNQLIQILYELTSVRPDPSQYPAVITNIDIRKRFRLLIEKELPQLAVLCYQELKAGMKLQLIEVISIT
ncbi:FHIPEP family type III secretion protein [Chloroflexi bacterium TSY]|nr:FHIPEP family type III secretion protein [Chloroflexi bacterium TSY]